MGIETWLVKLGRLMGMEPASAWAGGRMDKRNQCLITSEFGYFGNVGSALIKNLDHSGAFVETQLKFHVGEVVQLKFPLHYLDPPVEVTGVIAWTGYQGVGVKFVPDGTA